MNGKVMSFGRSPRAEAEAEACRWVMRIDAGPLDADERRQLQDWLAQDPEHPRLLDRHALLWATASRARFPQPAAARRDSPRPVLPGSRSRPMLHWGRTRPRPTVWALASVGAVALAATLWRGLPPLPTGHAPELAVLHSTPVGRPAPVALPDGSRTELNAASALRVAYSATHRRVLLERGEVLFDVAKDKTRPFEVVVGDTVVRAVGTRFLVQRRESGRVEVTVYEGVVEVSKTPESGPEDATDEQHPDEVMGPPAPQPIRLGAGQVAISAPEQMLVALSQPQALGRKLAWQQGRLEFDRSPLADALEEVNRYSAVPIRLGSAELGAMQVSGSFSTRDTLVFLRSLEKGFGLRVQRVGDAWVLSQPAP